jgi:hypothetical protein
MSHAPRQDEQRNALSAPDELARAEHAFSQAHDWARSRLSTLAAERSLDEQALRWLEGPGRAVCARLAQEKRRGELNALFDWLRQPEAPPLAPEAPRRGAAAEATLAREIGGNARSAEPREALSMALAWREKILVERWRAVPDLAQADGAWGELLGPLAAEAEALRMGQSEREALEWALRSRQGAQVFSWRPISEAQADGPAPAPDLLCACLPGELSALLARSGGAPSGALLGASLALARRQARLTGAERLRVRADSLWAAFGLECLPGGLVRQERDAPFSPGELSAALGALERLAADPAGEQASIAVAGFCANLLALAPLALSHPALATRLDALATRVDPKAWARHAQSASALGWLSPLRAAARSSAPLERSAEESLLQAALWAASQDLPEAASVLAEWAGARDKRAAEQAFALACQAGAWRAARALEPMRAIVRRRARWAWLRAWWPFGGR